MAEHGKSGSPGKGGFKIDLATLGGLLVAVGGILAGFMLEGGNVRQILQGTAALIVFGGTIGAVMVRCPFGWGQGGPS